jgi:nucleobase:cation symporter-1, NCS1 family
MSIEERSIEHIGKSSKHGKPFMTFTLWLAANLTIADYALGAVLYGLGLNYMLLALVIGNLLAGLLLGLTAAMGPKFGYPQMMISRAYFGKKGNAPLAVANWLSTLGWFTVNVILGSYALQLALGIPFYASALLLVAVQALLAIYGHDVIHKFEMIMSIVLGVMFIAVGMIAYSGAKANFAAYESAATFNPYTFALVIAVIFSYLMSWAPYASDYSRYLPENTSPWKIAAYAMAGGAIASIGLELIGVLVYISVGGTASNPINALAQVSGGYALFSLTAIILGAIAANALNLYTNSLSAKIVYEKAKRWQAVLLSSIVGFALAVVGATNFVPFYESFLITLDYWITPWIGVMIGAFFFKAIRSGVETQKGVAWRAVGAYLMGLAVSVPFMNLKAYGIPYTGFVASVIGGADVSYFVSLLAALVCYLALSRE